jgi:hypothetical protein
MPCTSVKTVAATSTSVWFTQKQATVAVMCLIAALLIVATDLIAATHGARTSAPMQCSTVTLHYRTVNGVQLP